MDGNIRIFVLHEARSRHGAIENAIGTTGRWPLRRGVSYQTGVNCDAIAVQDQKLHVMRRGRTIAVADLIGNRGPLARALRAVRGTFLRSRAAGSQGTEWEDLLRPRRPK